MNNTNSIVFFSVFLPDSSLPLPSKGDHGKLRFVLAFKSQIKLTHNPIKNENALK